MEEEILVWFAQAEKDLNAAKNSIRTKDYGWASFQAHQAAEKALKALFISLFKRLWKVHDLVELGRKVKLPDEILKCCEGLNPHYIRTRYAILVTYDKDEAKKAVEDAKKVIDWVKRKLKK